MTPPVAALRSRVVKLDPAIDSKSRSANQSQPQRSALAVAVTTALNEGDNNPDNQQKLNQLNSLVTGASSEELNNLIDALPDNALKQWVKEIQKNAVPNSGLSADQRQEFFSLLGRGLTPDQANRWQSVLPESLQDEFSSAVMKYSITDQGQPEPDANSQGSEQDSLFILGNTLEARSLQLSLSQDPAADDTAQSRSAPITESATTSVSPEHQAFIDAIDTIAPDATSEVKQQLVDAYTRVKTEMAAVDTPGNDPKALATAILETNNLFREHGLGNLLPASKKGHIYFYYNSNNLPTELSHYKSRKTSNDREFGDRDWSVRVSLGSLPSSLLLKTAARQLAAPLGMAAAVRSDQFDTERGFAASQSIDDAVTDIEQTLFAGGAPDTDVLFSKMQALDEHVIAEGGTALTKTENGNSYISAQLLRFTDDGRETDAKVGSGEWGWINTANLNAEQFVGVADQQRIDVLSSQLDETGTTDLDTATRGINALNPEGTEQENQKLVNQYLKLQRSIQVASRNPELESNILNNLKETDGLFREAGLPAVVPGRTKRGHYRIRFNSSNLPPELSHRKSNKTSNDREFGDRDWYTDVSLGDLPTRLLVKYAKSQLVSIPAAAATSNLSQMDQFAGFPVTHTADIQAMMDSAQPLPAGTSTEGEPVLGDLLQKFDAESAAPDSKYDYRALADTSYQVASSLLTDSAGGMSQEEMKTLISWVDAESLDDVGFYNREEVRDHNDETSIKHLGTYGNFGQAKYRFAQAWLGSSKEERLDYLGVDKGRWMQAQPYIATAINSDRQAKAIERAEFGLDDLVKVVIAGVASYVTGGLASGAVAGLFGTGGALVGTASAATATYLGAAAGAAAAGFSSTFIMTNGDIEESLKSGLMGALTGGLTKYASSLQGAARPVAQAIIMGVQSELNGKDFQDGVLASVAQNFGAGVADKLKPHMPEFIAGFAGKTTEVAIRTGGDKELMQQELEQYVINFASGQATAKLTAVMGEDYKFVANSLGDLANVVIQSGGDMGKVRDYLNSDQFYASLGSNLGNQVTQSFGGKEKFSAVLYGKITNIMIASRGDTDKIANNIEGLALSVVGEWAGNKLTNQLSGVLGETKGGLAEALGSLTNVAITSSWDANAINTFMNGPLVAALGKEAAGVIPERFGSAGEFLGKALERLTQSYSVNQGDMQAVAKDMAQFIVDEAIDFSEQVEANKPLSVGDTGPRVEQAQTQLQNYGYLDTVTGTFDTATADAVSRFQQDQIEHLTTALSAETNITLRRMINDQITAINTERDAGKIDVTTRVLLDKPYTNANGVTTNDTTNPPGDLTTNSENAPLIDLGVGSNGPGVTRLQTVLTDLGYDAGTIDGIFGENTAAALNQFQQDQLELLQNKLPDVSRTDQPEFYNLLTRLGSDLVVEQGQDKTGELTASLLANPITSEMLDDPALNGVLSADDMASLIEATVNNQPQEGLIKVGLLSSIFGDSTSLKDIAGMLAKQSPGEVAKTIDKVDLGDIEKWANQMGDMSVGERADLFEVLTKNLDGERLARFYGGMSESVKQEYVNTISKLGDEQLKEKFVETVQRGVIEKVDVPAGMTPDEKKLYLDLFQMGLDVAGIFEPTPFADGANTAISLMRGDWLGAGLSALGMIPYIGDLAKVGKLGKWAQTAENVVSLAAKNSAFAEKVRPLLTKISDLIENTPKSVFDKLPANVRETLTSVKQKIDEAIGKVQDNIPPGRPTGDLIKLGDDIPNRIEIQAPPRAELDQSDIDRFSYNHETAKNNIAEGVGTARADAVLDGNVRMPATDDLGVDFYVNDVPVSLKGPLINGTSGADLEVTSGMVEGLSKSVLKDIRLNTATDTIVIDMLNMSATQRQQLKSSIEKGLESIDKNKTIIFLE